MTIKSRKSDGYVKANDNRIAAIEADVDSVRNQLKWLINSVETHIMSIKEMNEATDKLNVKNKIVHEVKAKLNADEDELKRKNERKAKRICNKPTQRTGNKLCGERHQIRLSY